MLAAVKHGFGNLFNFQGRDARQAFWYYVLIVYVITMAIGLVVSIPMSIEAMMVGVRQGMEAAENPGQPVSEAAIQSAVASSMAGYMPILLWTGIASALILLVGLAASLVRRLHDSGLSGWWALIPGGLQAFSIVLLPDQIGKMDNMMNASLSSDPTASLTMMQGSFGIGAAAGWVAILAVVVFGTRKSTEGPNHYGDAPFRA